MERRIAAILMLTLSLPSAALLVAADGVGVDTILLPSDGGLGLATNKGGEEQTLPETVVVPKEKNVDVGAVLEEEEERPWTCCNSTVCTKSIPPTCRCLDEVAECAAACKLCEPSGFNPAFHVCKDQYHGDPGPTCAEEERPWTCCDRTVCTKSFPPTCRCLDEVEECAPACKRCEPFGINPKIKVCNDQYHGDPGPKCSEDDDDDSGSPPSQLAAATQMQLLIVSLILLFIQSR